MVARLRSFEAGNSGGRLSDFRRATLVTLIFREWVYRQATHASLGAIVRTTERVLPQGSKESDLAQADEDSDDEVQALDDIPETVKVLDSAAEFKEVIVWAHDQLPDDNDSFLKSVEEWLSFAAAIHRP
jgi:Ribonuclease H2 non-catalytic subunit (Ylr154p-like)